MDVFSMNFGRTEVIIGASKAKCCRESFGEVRFCVAPQKPGKNRGKLVFETKQMSNKFLWHRKIKCWESSETHFPEVSGQTEPSLGGKRLFKILQKNNFLYVFDVEKSNVGNRLKRVFPNFLSERT